MRSILEVGSEQLQKYKSVRQGERLELQKEFQYGIERSGNGIAFQNSGRYTGDRDKKGKPVKRGLKNADHCSSNRCHRGTDE